MTVYTWTGGNGSWGNASDWGPNGLPTLNDDVIIDTPNITVSVSTGVAAQAYQLTVSAGTLDITKVSGQLGGTLHTVYNAVLAAGTFYYQDAGTWTMDGLGATFNGTVNMVGGTIDVTVGAMVLNNGGYLGGTLAGYGSLDINAGDAYLEAGFKCTLNNIVVGANGGKLGLNTNVTFAHNLTLDSSGVLTLFGYTLTLSGASQLLGVAGDGTLIDSGTMTIGGSQIATLDNGLILQVKGSLTQAGNISAGASDSGAKIEVLKTGTYTINGNWTVGDSSSVGTFTDGGTLIKNAGGKQAVIDTSFTSTGKIDVGIGSLLLGGTVNVVGGTISGAGTLAFGSNAFDRTSLGTKAVLNVACVDLQAGALFVNAPLSYGGEWDQSAGVLDLNTSKVVLTLGGRTDFSGGTITGFGGTLALGGATQLGNLTIGGPETIAVTGTVHQTNSITLGLSSNTNVTIAAGSSWMMDGNGNINDNSIIGAFGFITNVGTFGVGNGSSDAFVGSSIDNSGTILSNNSVLSLAGPVNDLAGTLAGSGLIDLTAGLSVIEAGAVVSVASLAVDSSGTLQLAASLAYAHQFTQLGTLNLGNNTLTLSGTASLVKGIVFGGGEVLATGSAVLTSVTIDNTLSLTGQAEQANGNITDNGIIDVATSGTYTLDDDLGTTQIAGTGELTVEGSLIAAATGTTSIVPFFALTGSLTVDDQRLILQGGGSLAGAISGTGTLELQSLNYTLGAGLNATVAALQLDQGSNVTLATNVTYGGALATSGGAETLTVAGHTLTLSGGSTLTNTYIEGSGTVLVSGSGTLNNALVIDGAKLTVTGTVEQLGQVQVGDSAYNVTPASSELMTIAAGATDTLETYGTITGNGTLAVAGTLVAAANVGTGNNPGLSIGPTIIDTGIILANLGTLTIQSAVSGAGSFSIATGGELLFGTLATIGGSTSIDFTTGGGDLQIQKNAGFNATLVNFSAHDMIELTGIIQGSASFTYGANHDQIVISDTSGDSITLNFSTAQTLSALSLTTGTHGFTTLVHS